MRSEDGAFWSVVEELKTSTSSLAKADRKPREPDMQAIVDEYTNHEARRDASDGSGAERSKEQLEGHRTSLAWALINVGASFFCCIAKSLGMTTQNWMAVSARTIAG